MAYCSQNPVVIQKSRYVNNNKRIVYTASMKTSVSGEMMRYDGGLLLSLYR